MSAVLKVIICGEPASITNYEWCLPVPVKVLYNLQAAKNYVESHHANECFILILFDLFGHNTLDSLMIEIGNPKSILKTYNYVNQNLSNGHAHGNVHHLPRRRIRFAATLHAISACQSTSQSLSASNHRGALGWHKKATDLAHWLVANNQVELCDFLIIPLNTDDDNLRDFQQAVIEKLKDICGHDEMRVCTLSDYICSDAALARMSEEECAFVTEQNKITCELLLQKMAPIRMYLLGNAENISDKWSRVTLESEPNIASEPHKYWRHEPVTKNTLEGLYYFEKGLREVTLDMLSRVETIQANPGHFQGLVNRGQLTSQDRETCANEFLESWTLSYLQVSNKHSDKLHPIGEAQGGLMEQDSISQCVLDDITERIQAVNSSFDQ